MNNTVVNFDAEKFRKVLLANGNTPQQLSIISGRSESYVATCLSRGKIGVRELNQLCAFYGVPAKNFIIVEEVPTPTENGDIVARLDEINSKLDEILEVVKNNGQMTVEDFI